MGGAGGVGGQGGVGGDGGVGGLPGCLPAGPAAGPEPGIDMNDLPRGPAQEQGLLMDTLFVDVPLEVDDPPANWIDPFSQTLLPGLQEAWFCDNDAACTADFQAAGFTTVERLIPPGTPEAGAAPDRFLRVRFRRPIRPEALGPAIGFTRFRAEASGPAIAYVGREPAAVILSGPARADRATREYAVARLGLRPLPPGPSVDPVVNVAVLDTGVDARVAAALGVQRLALPGGDLVGDLHEHGSQMALLVRQVTDRAILHDVRVLGTNGVGPVGDVARGLFAALALGAADPDRALILNLSIGWPPELGMARNTRDVNDVINGREDPVGESVRYALMRTQQRAAQHPVLVVAAAGNRPGRPEAVQAVYHRWFDVIDGIAPPTGCAQAAPAGARLFFPAEWSRVPSCVARAPQAPRLLTWSVGALGVGGTRSALAIEGVTPGLWAPGEHAYVEIPQVPESTPQFECNAGPERGLRSPMAISGTSVSAAFATGVTTRLLAAAFDRRTPLTGAAAALIVQSTARAGEPGPHLDACRAEGALLCRNALCLNPTPDGTPAAADVATCAQALDGCDRLMACPQPPPAPPLDALGFGREEACFCQEANPVPLAEATCQSADVVCPFEASIDVHSRGFAGPQPYQPTCPECMAYVNPGQAKVDLALALDEGITGVTFVNAWLVLKSGGASHWRALNDLTALDQWVAGQAVYIAGVTVDPTLAQACQTACTATVYGNVNAPGGTTTLTSAMRVKVQ